MKKLLLLLALAFALPLMAQVPNPNFPLSGTIGTGGSFPLLNSGTLVFSSDANRTMVYPEMSASVIRVTSTVTLTATRNLVAPIGIGFQFIIQNATTGAQSITVIGATGTGVTIASGSTVHVFCDGTNYVQVSGSGGGGAVSSVFSRTGNVVATTGDYTVSQITGAAPLASPALTGTPTAPTASALDNSTKVANTAYADRAAATANATTVNGVTPTGTPVATVNSSGQVVGTRNTTLGVIDGDSIYCGVGTTGGTANWASYLTLAGLGVKSANVTQNCNPGDGILAIANRQLLNGNVTNSTVTVTNGLQNNTNPGGTQYLTFNEEYWQSMYQAALALIVDAGTVEPSQDISGYPSKVYGTQGTQTSGTWGTSSHYASRGKTCVSGTCTMTFNYIPGQDKFIIVEQDYLTSLAYIVTVSGVRQYGPWDGNGLRAGTYLPFQESNSGNVTSWAPYVIHITAPATYNNAIVAGKAPVAVTVPVGGTIIEVIGSGGDRVQYSPQIYVSGLFRWYQSQDDRQVSAGNTLWQNAVSVAQESGIQAAFNNPENDIDGYLAYATQFDSTSFHPNNVGALAIATSNIASWPSLQAPRTMAYTNTAGSIWGTKYQQTGGTGVSFSDVFGLDVVLITANVSSQIAPGRPGRQIKKQICGDGTHTLTFPTIVAYNGVIPYTYVPSTGCDIWTFTYQNYIPLQGQWIASVSGGVTSFIGRTGSVTATSGDYTVSQVTGSAPLASPALTGTPTTPTATPGTNNTQVASTAYSDAAVAVETTRATGVEATKAPLASPALTGTPTVPTAAPGTNTTQAASTAFVSAAVAGSGVSSFNSRTGAVAPTTGDYSVAQVTGAAPLASPALTGTPTVPTASGGTNTTQAASTAFVTSALTGYAPAFTVSSPLTYVLNQINCPTCLTPSTLITFVATLSAATSDTFSWTGLNNSQGCVFSPSNSTATTSGGNIYIGTPGSGSVTVFHSATLVNGGTITITCSPLSPS